MDYSWFKERTYLHFDPPITKHQINIVAKIVSDPIEVAKHSFYPLIKFEVVKFKMKDDPQEEVRKLDKSKTRELTYCAHLDSHILSYYSQNLQQLYEKEIYTRNIHNSILAFRKLKTDVGKSKNNIHFANEAFDSLSSMKEGTVYAFDLKKFFDSIDHDLLKKRWCDLLQAKTLPDDHYKIFKFLTNRALVTREALIKEFNIPKHNALNKMNDRRICTPADFRARVRKKGLIEKSNEGIAQGSPISALLSNIFLIDFDKEIVETLHPLGCIYYRYCDDILIIAPKNVEFNIEKFIEGKVSSNKLKINDDKTDIIKFAVRENEVQLEKPLQYLGFMFDGHSKYVRAGSLSQYLRKARLAIKRHKIDLARKNKIRKVKGLPEKKLYRKSLLESYSHIGKKNFISYGLRASVIMDSKKIRRQMNKLNKLLTEEIQKV